MSFTTLGLVIAKLRTGLQVITLNATWLLIGPPDWQQQLLQPFWWLWVWKKSSTTHRLKQIMQITHLTTLFWHRMLGWDLVMSYVQKPHDPGVSSLAHDVQAKFVSIHPFWLSFPCKPMTTAKPSHSLSIFFGRWPLGVVITFEIALLKLLTVPCISKYLRTYEMIRDEEI